MKSIITYCASKEVNNIIFDYISSSYKIYEAHSKLDVFRILDKNKDDILAIFVDAVSSYNEALTFLEYRKNDVLLMLIPAIAYIKPGDKVSESAFRERDITNFIYYPLVGKDVLRDLNSIARRYALDETRMEEKYISDIEKNKSNLKELINSLSAGIFVVEILKGANGSSKFDIVLHNKLFLQIFEIDFFTFEYFFSKISNEDTSNFLNAINECSNDFECRDVTVNFTDSDNTIKTIEISIRQCKNYENNNIRFVCSAYDRTKDENVVKEKKDKDLILSSMLDTLDGGVVVFSINDNSTNIKFANKTFFNIFGFKENDSNIIDRIFSSENLKAIYNAGVNIASNEFGNNDEQATLNIKLIKKDYTIIHSTVKMKVLDFDGKRLTVLAVIRDNTQDVEIQNRLRKLTDCDTITGLFNSAKFSSLSQDMIQKFDDGDFQLLVFTIYNYMPLQTLLGQKLMNDLAKTLADGIKKICKKTIKGRIETDTFALCYETKNFDAKTLATQIQDYISRNFQPAKIKLYFGCYSIDDHYVPIDTMIIRTIYAINEIKGSALNYFVNCDNKLRVRASQNDAIRNEMESALKNNEFEVFLQPVYDIKTRKIVSAEALTRWKHPKRGYLPPDEYIPIFEENGFIVNVDNFVWNYVCRLLKAWIISNKKVVPISVNVSRVDLFHINFYEKITRLVEQYQIPPNLLRLEITESAYVVAEESITEIVEKLRKYGFTVLMDDFGSGYSSLNSLKDISVDILKIDMGLVRGMENNPRTASILKSVIELGNSLQLNMICEGIEKESQAEFVSKYGCTKAQGWLFSKALPVNEFRLLLDKDS